MWRDKGDVRVLSFGNGCRAERSWAVGNGLKGAGTRVGYLVLGKVSKNLPLLISAPTRLTVQC